MFTCPSLTGELGDGVDPSMSSFMAGVESEGFYFRKQDFLLVIEECGGTCGEEDEGEEGWWKMHCKVLYGWFVEDVWDMGFVCVQGI